MFNKLLGSVKSTFQQDRARFYLIASRTVIYLLTYITLLLPLFVGIISGNTFYFTLKDMGALGSFFGLLWWAIIIGYILSEFLNVSKINLVWKVQFITSIVYTLIMLIYFFSNMKEASNYSTAIFKIGISLFLTPIFLVLTYLMNHKPSLFMPTILKFLPKGNTELAEDEMNDATPSEEVLKE